MENIDSYEKFLKWIQKDEKDFIKWGIDNVIGLNDKKYVELVKKDWQENTLKIIEYYEKNGNLENLEVKKEYWPAIRNRKIASKIKENLYKDVYEKIFPDFKYEIYYDSTCNEKNGKINNLIFCSRDGNNLAGKTLTQLFTRYNKGFDVKQGLKKCYVGYSICHIFEGTNNWILYRCPWNIFLVPNIVVSLTDKNSPKVQIQEKFYSELKKRVFKEFAQEIKRYNQFLERTKIQDKIQKERKNIEKKRGYKYVENNWEYLKM